MSQPPAGSPPDLGPVATAILDASDTMVVLTDRRGTIQYVNPAFTAVTGYAAHEAIGGTPRLLRSGAQDDAFYTKLWTTVLGGSTWHGELINRRKDGSLYADEMTIVPLNGPDGAPSSVEPMLEQAWQFATRSTRPASPLAQAPARMRIASSALSLHEQDASRVQQRAGGRSHRTPARAHAGTGPGARRGGAALADGPGPLIPEGFAELRAAVRAQLLLATPPTLQPTQARRTQLPGDHRKAGELRTGARRWRPRTSEQRASSPPKAR